MKTVDTKLILGPKKNRKKYPAKLVYTKGRIFFVAEFNKKLNAEIKLMSGHAYHAYQLPNMRDWVSKTFGTDKIWSVVDDQHNAFQLRYLQGDKPYAAYKSPLPVYEHLRPELMDHQRNGVSFLLTRRCCILSGEMGVGKTLTEIQAREIAKPQSAWYVAPRSGIKAVERELRKWECLIRPTMMTYNGLVKRVKQLEGFDFKPPQWLTLDESSCVKTPTSQRTMAAVIMANAMREYWGDDCWIILMSGSPAPLSPLDWWAQCHIACPGYLIEGDIGKLKRRLAVLVDRDFGGGPHKHIETWRDRDDICDTCGKVKNHPNHGITGNYHEFEGDGACTICGEVEEHVDHLDPEILDVKETHEFELAINEVKKLHRRMDGLVLVQLKSDCLDLPEKRFETIELEPSKKLLQIARTMARNAPSAVEALTRLRTLSDGFLYKKEKLGTELCPICRGKKEALDWVVKPEFEFNLPPLDSIDNDDPELKGPQYSSEREQNAEVIWREIHFDHLMMPCIKCEGKGEIDVFTRTVKELVCPKEDALREKIDQHVEVGRLVTYAGFTGSVDRCVRIFEDMGWQYIRWDGRGIHSSVPNIDPLDLFQDAKLDYPRVGFIGQPGAAGMGLTLTASPSSFYWSNTHNAQDRIQSVDRIHRPSMNVNRGATIFDALHLPTDYLVLAKLNEKIARQDLTLGVDVSMAEILDVLS